MHKNIPYILLVLAVFQASTADSQELGATHVNYGGDTLSVPPRQEAEHWWEIFGYPQLDNLVLQALAENRQLRVGENEVKVMEEQVKLAKSSLYPELAINAAFSRQAFSGNRPVPFDVPVTRITYDTYSLPVDVSYEVDVFGRNVNKVQASKMALLASSATQENSQLQVASAVVQNYIVLLTLDSEAAILHHTLEARKENLDIVQTRYEAGLSSEIDFQRAKSELSSVEIQVSDLQIQRKEAELRLATLTGQPAGTFALESSGVKYYAPLVNVQDNHPGWSRPDLEASRYQVEAYRKELSSARKNRYPSLYLNGSLGLLSGSYDHLVESDSRAWLVGASLSIPVFQGGRRQALRKVSEYQLKGAEEMLSQNELLAHQEVEQKLADLGRLDEQIEAQQSFLDAAYRAADLSRQRYQKGLVTYLEVVDADRIVLEAERQSVRLLSRQLLSTVDLMVALGGDMR